MYVCLCLGITDRDIKQHIAKGPCSVAEVMACTGAGTKCGSCRSTIEAMVEGASPGVAPTPSVRRLDMIQILVPTPA